ncbi:MAG TPA: c-type cytochrome [Polyangia bacterium]|jgi:cytochrome c553|nr:c-type cytochrome [Polyangia bacterium]
MACSSSTTPAKDGGAGSGGSKAGSGGSTAGAGGGTAGSAAGSDGGAGTGTAGTDGSTDGDAATDGPVLTAQQTRGQYLVKSVLGCAGCHTPQLAGGAGPDNTKFLAGVACFSKGATAADCLNSANLTNDATGLKNLTDEQVKAAFTTGIYPESEGGTQYLFAQMPYYQFSFLTSTDADAIVAYLRTVTAVPTPATTAPNGGTFATRPTAPQWATPSLASFPSQPAADGGTDGGADAATDANVDGATASVSNGKYLAALLCSTCHTVNTSATAPLELDVTKAFEGGKVSTASVTVAADGGTDAADGGDGGTTTVSKQIESANLTSDTTGLAGWTAPQILTAIKTAKDKEGRSICGMRAVAGLTDEDATDIANYLQAIPPVANTITMTCY